MLIVQDITYIHPDNTSLFNNLSFSIQKNEKIGLVGNNGVGKSILLKLLIEELKPNSGTIQIEAIPYLVPQLYGQLNFKTVAEALNISNKLNALNEIINGSAEEFNFTILDEDWAIEDRCLQALNHWDLKNISLNDKMENLSGGQKTKVLLAGISIHQPDLVILDEPSNHLDRESRKLLYNFIEKTDKSLIVVSHDVYLLNLLNKTLELSGSGLKTYGGNYTFYKEQKALLEESLAQNIIRQERELKRIKEKSIDIIERQQKLDSRGKRKQECSGLPKILMNTLKNKAENTTSKLKSEQQEKILISSKNLMALRAQFPNSGQMKLNYDNSDVHKGKVLVELSNVNLDYSGHQLWNNHLSLDIRSGDRVAILGKNASGKTTLLKLMLNIKKAKCGAIRRNFKDYIYVDQDYSSLKPSLSVYEQIEDFNQIGLLEHELKLRLSRFLFDKDDWSKLISSLSGGERMRLLLCCMQVSQKMPDLMVLDEPTNNLDIQNLEILTHALGDYQGTIIVVSHDEHFLNQIKVNRYIDINS